MINFARYLISHDKSMLLMANEKYKKLRHLPKLSSFAKISAHLIQTFLESYKEGMGDHTYFPGKPVPGL